MDSIELYYILVPIKGKILSASVKRTSNLI